LSVIMPHGGKLEKITICDMSHTSPQWKFPSFTCLSPDVPAFGLLAYWGPAFQHRPPHRLLATKLNELDHQTDDADHQGRHADHQNHHSACFHAYHLPFRRK